MPRLLIFELDGGTWSVLDPLIKQGKAPHMASLIRRGTRGVLRSLRPMVSPALWTTIYTGQPSDQHGVQGFDAVPQDIRYLRLWDIAHSAGMVCGVCGSLVTWPPYDVGGLMIPDIMARDDRTIPPRFAALQRLTLNYPRSGDRARYGLSAYIRYGLSLPQAWVRPSTMAALAAEVLTAALLQRSRRDTYWRRVLLFQRLYADAFAHWVQAQHPDLATYHFHAVDTLSHRYWPDESTGDTKTGKGKSDVIARAYQAADHVLGQLLEASGPDVNVVILSDHGFRANAEPWSRTTGRLSRWIQVLGLEGLATPTRLGQQHFIYFRDPQKVEETANKLRAALVKETGTPLLPQVVTRDRSLFFLPPRVAGEGLTVLFPGGVEIPFAELFTETGHVETGTHDLDGLVIMAGPSIREGGALQSASILDAAPTMLALLGLPVARDMTGRVWMEALRPDFLARFPLALVDTYRQESRGPSGVPISAEDTAILHQRLSDLGYL